MLDVTDATALDRSVVAVAVVVSVVVAAAAGDVAAAEASDRTLEMAEDASLRIELTEEPSHRKVRTVNGKRKKKGEGQILSKRHTRQGHCSLSRARSRGGRSSRSGLGSGRIRWEGRQRERRHLAADRD